MCRRQCHVDKHGKTNESAAPGTPGSQLYGRRHIEYGTVDWIAKGK